MAKAFKCDRCGGFYEKRKQTFLFDYDDINGYAQETEVLVDSDRDFCPKCVKWALNEAAKRS